jgi:hypothetical protein
LPLDDLSVDGWPNVGGSPGGGPGPAAEVHVRFDIGVHGEQGRADCRVGGRHAEDGVRETVEVVGHAERGVVDLLGAVAG